MLISLVAHVVLSTGCLPFLILSLASFSASFSHLLDLDSSATSTRLLFLFQVWQYAFAVFTTLVRAVGGISSASFLLLVQSSSLSGSAQIASQVTMSGVQILRALPKYSAMLSTIYPE